MLSGVSLVPFLPWFPIDAREALGSWQSRKNLELIAFCTSTVPSVTCGGGGRAQTLNIQLGGAAERKRRVGRAGQEEATQAGHCPVL